MNIWVGLDAETTGVEPGSRMVELAGIAFDDNGIVQGNFHSLVNPGMPMPPDAGKINNLTDEMLAAAPTAEEVLKNFFAWLPSKRVVAHNAPFDIGIVSWEAGRCGLTIPEGLSVADTCEIARSLKEPKNNKLITLVEHHKLKSSGAAHRALSDADLCAQLYCLYRKRGHHGTILPWDDAGHNYRYSGELPASLQALPELVRTGSPFSFGYTDAKGAQTQRTISPYGWAQVNDGIQFHGLCHLRQERRTFKAESIS